MFCFKNTYLLFLHFFVSPWYKKPLYHGTRAYIPWYKGTLYYGEKKWSAENSYEGVRGCFLKILTIGFF